MVNSRDFELISTYILEQSGIEIPPEKSYLIETRFSGLLARMGLDSFADLYQRIIDGSDPGLRKKVINAITTNETMWFRDTMPWKILEEKALPNLIQTMRAGAKHRARIWFAAVSTGQEAYSTVMCVDNYLKKNKITDITLDHFEFTATDISTDVLDMARSGRYDRISMSRGLCEDYKERYFKQSGAAWELDPDIRGAVRFAEFNLLNSFASLGIFDIIFCRYVLIYFSDALKREIVQKLYASLAGGGLLFTGSYVLYELFADYFDSHYAENHTYFTRKG